MRKKTLFRGSIAVSTAAILAAGVLGTPARAADPVTITIWTFGDVIQRQIKQFQQRLIAGERPTVLRDFAQTHVH